MKRSPPGILLLLEERSGLSRCDEPVTVGIPLPQGAVFDPATLFLEDAQGKECLLQAQVLAHWFDGSAKWVLLDFQATVGSNKQAEYRVSQRLAPFARKQKESLVVQQSAEAVVIDTGQGRFCLNSKVCKPFDQVVIQDVDILATEGSSLTLTDEAGSEYQPYVDTISVETSGLLRTTVKIDGTFSAKGNSEIAQFIAYLNFYAANSFVEMQLTVHNPRAACHASGLWDLGDDGSIYLKNLFLKLPLRTSNEREIVWTTRRSQPAKTQTAASLEIYQDSSGGENWRSTNHVNRFGLVPHTFRGYQVTADSSMVEEGYRATPIIVVQDGDKSITAAIEKFWQNFPKSLEVNRHQLTLGIFPQQYGEVFELQGGEQKTHTVYLHFTKQKERPENFGWVHDRLIPRVTPEAYSASKAFSYLTPRSQDLHVDCLALVDTAIEGPQSFFVRREIIDEYGWRHFGDLYADHEAVGHVGEAPLVAHYNNQYDGIFGAFIQYARSGDQRWYDLACDLASHVIDIDIYHTQEDRPAYNGGLFWHTDHYLDAGTATHRAYSKSSLIKKDPEFYGGGPSNEHNYTTGLLYYYFLTGRARAREAVQGLADWVINMDDGSQRFFGYFDRRPTGNSSVTASHDYHGPGRGAGNSINALLDAYVLLRQERYLAKAEELICRCIHPKDNVEERQLEDPERRWSYTVFLQVLGKYLDLKTEKGEADYMYGYAQASLLHYARWMLEHEVPYACVLDKVDIPTETWPAQDIRKSSVFHLAAKHATDPLRKDFQQKADFFFESCIGDLQTFPTCTLTRPVVLLMSNAYVHTYFQLHPEENAPQVQQSYDFGAPRQFSPQFSELHWVRKKFATWKSMMSKMKRYFGNVTKGALPEEEGHG